MDVVPRAEWVRHGNVGYIHTYIHKEYLYRAYYPNSESLYALRSLNKQEAQLMLTTGSTRLAVNQGQQT